MVSFPEVIDQFFVFGCSAPCDATENVTLATFSKIFSNLEKLSINIWTLMP